jgi:hypothetical protein
MIVERKQRRRRTKPSANELLQTAVVSYLAQALPPTAFFSIFPLGRGGLFHGLRMRSLGVREGFPNLLVLYDGCAYCIELRPGRSLLLPSQRDCYAALQDARVPVTVARSLADVQRFLSEECALPMRNWRSVA